MLTAHCHPNGKIGISVEGSFLINTLLICEKEE